MALLQTSGLCSLGNIVAVADEISEYPFGNFNARKIKNLLPEDNLKTLKSMVQKFFGSQQTRANCYAYSINFQASYPGSKPDPGGKVKEYKAGLHEDFKKAVIEGAVDDGLLHAGSVKPEEKRGYYRVALAFRQGENIGYHWLRENYNSNSWSHKNGHSVVSNCDDRGQVITDPELASIENYKVEEYFYVIAGGIKPQCLDAG